MANFLELLANMLGGQGNAAPVAAGPVNRLMQLGGTDTPAGGGALDAVGQRIMQQQLNPYMGGAAPVNAQPAPVDNVQTTSTPAAGPSGGGIGGFVQNLFGGGDQKGYNETVQWLQRKGYDAGAAQMIAKDKPTLQKVLMTYGSPQEVDEYTKRATAALKLGLKQGTPEYTNFIAGRDIIKDQNGDSWLNMGDGRVFNQRTGEFREAPGGSHKPPQIEEFFDPASGQQYKAQWNEQTQSWDRIGGIKARSDGMVITTNPDGTTTIVQGGNGDNLPKLTESEGRSTGFYGRGVESHEILNDLESQGTSLWNSTVGNIPVVGNYARTEDAQKYDQAKRNFINAVLRRESGAVISPEEFKNAEQQYFPQPGDGEEVIAQKRRNREVTIQGLKVSSGQGANFALPPEGQPTQPTKPTDNGAGGWQDLGGGVKIRRKQ